MVSGWQRRQRRYPSTLSPTSAPSDHPTQPIPKQPTSLPPLPFALPSSSPLPSAVSPRTSPHRRATPSFRASPPHPRGAASAAPRRHGPARHPHSARPLRPASTWDARRGCEVADNAEIPPRRGSWLSASQPRAYENGASALPFARADNLQLGLHWMQTRASGRAGIRRIYHEIYQAQRDDK